MKSGQKFDPWWKNNWKLFAVPARGDVKQVLSISKSGSKNKIYLEIPLDTNTSSLVQKCKSIIENEIRKRKQSSDPSQHPSKFPLDVNENFDYLVWSRRLKCLRMKDRKVKRIDIYEDLCKKKMRVRKTKKDRTGLKEEPFYSPPTKDTSYWNRVSMVCRDINLANKFLKNIEKGRFSINFK